jgi:hypothetical protein
MGKSKSPPPPDYRGAAEESAQASREVTEAQTWANRPDQYTPWGTQQWQNQPVWDPTTDQYVNRWSQYTDLNPLTQKSLNQQQKLQLERSQLARGLTGRMWDEFGQGMDYGNLPGMAMTPEQAQLYGIDTSGMVDVGSADDQRNRAEQALWQRQMNMLEPQWQQREEDKMAQLVAQGLRPGDPAYEREMQTLAGNRQQAYQQAQLGAITGGGQEASRTFGMDMQRRQNQFTEMMKGQGFNNQQIQQMWQNQMAGAGFQNQLRQQAMAEQMQQRGFTLNEINALLHGQQVGMPQMPDFKAAQRSDPADYSGAAHQGYLGALQGSSVDAAQNPMGGLFQLGGQLGSAYMLGPMAAAASDPRLKTNIKRIGTTPGGAPWYSWTYIWGEDSEGVMSTDVPHAVIKGPGGFDYVDYGRVI